MKNLKSLYTKSLYVFPYLLQVILNVSLIILAIVLSVLLVKELILFGTILLEGDTTDYQLFLANVLLFFLYFEFVAMIVKYFKENYHFPLRYFLYIGITAMIRLIIVEHDNALDTLFYAFVILILIIGYFIMNLTPRERPESKWFFQNKR
ncbi:MULTISPECIES: phosphate-starvation-inducible protein PsiE [Virgibacillus]|uniref:Protein PsiE n=2 Tax=Virgibacillus TaxID=84406 RepID=A0A2K9J0T3_9BACI|nr:MULTISPECIES: phosphate-starvation-inducible protein PsiE [Virgibacillus]AUJ25516.1 phosphate-starvation-inducible protein PsiE [Virgibacillus dokdonensis]NWO13990.1 phosphate-starvation-inducible protein PsiE [Virgibacillus sp.]SHH99804.1 protein PsiE [Virgibacillus chiguensis]